MITHLNDCGKNDWLLLNSRNYIWSEAIKIHICMILNRIHHFFLFLNPIEINIGLIWMLEIVSRINYMKMLTTLDNQIHISMIYIYFHFSLKLCHECPSWILHQITFAKFLCDIFAIKHISQENIFAKKRRIHIHIFFKNWPCGKSLTLFDYECV